MGLWLHLSNQGYATLYPNHMGLSADSLCILVGAMSIVIAFFGCCGSFFESRCCLIIVSHQVNTNKRNFVANVATIVSFFPQYFSLIIVLFLSEFIVGALVFVFRTGISRALTMDIKDGIVKHYNTTDRGGFVTPSVSKIWDNIQTELQCCGVNSYEDWYHIENWQSYKWVPASCCRTRHSMPSEMYEGSGYDTDDDCRK
jgi:tetraspanin-9